MKTKMRIFLTIFLTVFVFIQVNYAMEIENNSLEEIAIEQQKNYKKVPWYKRATFKRDFAIVGTMVALCMTKLIHTKLIHTIEQEITALQNLKIFQEESRKYDEELEAYKLANYGVEPCILCGEFPAEISYEQCTCREKVNRYLCDECMIGCTKTEWWDTSGLHKCSYCRKKFKLELFEKPIKFEDKDEEPQQPTPKLPMARAGEKKETLAFRIAEWFVNLS